MIEAKHKKELLNRIKSIDNKDILDEIYRLLEVNFEDDSIYHLNEQQKTEIDQARNEIKQGKGIESNQADRDIDEWLER